MQDRVIGKYKVLEKLGAGAMATVYLVEHTQLGSRYALKVLDGAGKRTADRFLREARIQATLRHPNVVSVHDVLEVDGQPALLMDYVPGSNLQRHLLGEHPLPVEQIDALAMGILKGVRAIHEAGHVHRDIKPANILLDTDGDGNLVPRIADFGLAKVFGEDQDGPALTRTGQVVGSPAYMSPEQTLSSKQIDRRTDIWACGVVLYQLITGHLAFPHRDIVTIFSMIRSGEFEDPRALREGIPDRMWNAVFAAMKVDRDDRPTDVDMLLELWRGEREPEPAFTAEPTAEIPAPAPLAKPDGARWMLPLAGAGLLLAGLVAWLAWPQAPEPPATQVPQPTPVASPAPAPPPAPVPPPESAVPAPQEPEPDRPAPAPAPVEPTPAAPRPRPNPPAPSPKPPPPAPAPEPVAPPAPEPIAAPALGTVKVTGDAERVWLVRDGVHHDPGSLPAGSYSVAARFPGRPQGPIQGLTVEVEPGQSVTIACQKGFFTCTVR